jgi:hypothetical protein
MVGAPSFFFVLSSTAIWAFCRSKRGKISVDNLETPPEIKHIDKTFSLRTSASTVFHGEFEKEYETKFKKISSMSTLPYITIILKTQVFYVVFGCFCEHSVLVVCPKNLSNTANFFTQISNP